MLGDDVTSRVTILKLFISPVYCLFRRVRKSNSLNMLFGPRVCVLRDILFHFEGYKGKIPVLPIMAQVFE